MNLSNSNRFLALAVLLLLALGSSAYLVGSELRSVSAQGSSPNSVFLPSLETNSTAQEADVPTGPLNAADTGFVINSSSVALFDQIPDQYLTGARNLDMLFSDRSVGANINDGLNCLTASSWASAPASCRRDYYDAAWNWKTFTQTDLDAGQVPARILYSPSPVTYNRSNWTFEYRTGDWSGLTQDFIQSLAPAYVNSKDVLSYQFSYLNVDQGSDIANPSSGFFADNASRYDIHDLEAYMSQHSDKTFILWTTSLARAIGSQEATDFNNQMRQYALANDMVLFDVADILSHTDQGAPCYDNRNDGQNIPAICRDYTTEIDGGHLGSVSAGKIAVAKAFWVLMARLAGWDGSVGGTVPTATPTAPTTSTPTAMVTPTSPAGPTSTATSTAPATGTAQATPTSQTSPTPTNTPGSGANEATPTPWNVVRFPDIRLGPPTNTPAPPTNTPVRPTNTPISPTNTPGGPTNTPVSATNTPTATPSPTVTLDPNSAGWPMLGANLQRTSWTPEEATGRLNLEWYRPIEAYIPQNVQIIAANGLLYVSTSGGLYALNAASGDVAWRFDTAMPLGNSPTVIDGVAYVGGYDRKLHALNAVTGAHLWSFDGAKAGYSANPLVVDGKVIVGNRDGRLYAIGAHGTPQQGKIVWQFNANSPIRLSAAYADGVIHFAAANNFAYALDSNDGSLLWKSARLPGEQYQSYWPVIYRDKVIYSGSSGYRQISRPGHAEISDGVWTGILRDMQLHDIFPSQSEGTTIGPAVPDQAWAHGYPIIDASRVTEYLEDNPSPDPDVHKPWRRTYVVLNQSDGSEYTFDSDGDSHPEYLPAAWWGTNSGNRFPPLVGPDDTLYFNNLYTCCSDEKGRVMGWTPDNPSLLSVTGGFGALAEPQAISAGGNYIYRNLCCDRVGDFFNMMQPSASGRLWSYDLETKAPGYDSMWRIIPGLPRLVGWYKGKTAGANAAYHNHGDQNPIIPYQGRAYVHRSNAIIAFGPGAASGALPLLEAQPPAPDNAALPRNAVVAELESEINKIIDAGDLRPGYYGLSIATVRGFENAFDNPGDTLYTMARAYPYLSSGLQSEVRTYMQQQFAMHFDPNMHARLGWGAGAPRESMTLPPEVVADLGNFPPSTRSPYFAWEYPQHNFYAMWKYAEIVPDDASRAYELAKSKLQVPLPTSLPIPDYFDQRPFELNAYIAGYVGFLELQELAGMDGTDSALRSQVSAELDRLLALRANTFSKDSYFTPDRHYKKIYDVSRNFIFLVPELGDYLRQNAGATVAEALEEYVTIAPYWLSSRHEATIGEGALSPIQNYHALFQAHALIEDAPGRQLYQYLDAPAFEVGDLYYIQNLTAILENAD